MSAIKRKRKLACQPSTSFAHLAGGASYIRLEVTKIAPTVTVTTAEISFQFQKDNIKLLSEISKILFLFIYFYSLCYYQVSDS